MESQNVGIVSSLRPAERAPPWERDPDHRKGGVYRCITPCVVAVPQRMGFRVMVAKEGYVMRGPQPTVTWVEKKGAWWQGNMGMVLEPNNVTLNLVPAVPAAE